MTKILNFVSSIINSYIDHEYILHARVFLAACFNEPKFTMIGEMLPLRAKAELFYPILDSTFCAGAT